MSTKTLAITAVKPIGVTYEQFPIFQVNAGPDGTRYEEFQVNANTTLLSPPYQSICRVDLQYNYNDVYEIEEQYLSIDVINGSATDAPTFKNAYGLFSSVRVLINGVEVEKIGSYPEILCRISNYFREHSENLDIALARIRNDTAYTFTGDSIAVSATTNLLIPLTPLFPWLRNLVIGGSAMISKIQYEFTFQPNLGSAAGNGLFVTSGSANNAYSTNLSFSNIKIWQSIVRPDPTSKKILLARMGPLRIFKKCHEGKIKTISFTNVDTDMTTFSLKTDWATHSNVRGLYIFLESPALRTTFNDADNCKLFSGASFIGYKIRYNGTEVLNHSQSANHLKLRKNYSMDVQKNLWARNLPLEVLNHTTGLADYYYIETYIDLQNIQVYDLHEMVIGGISTDLNLQIDVFCAQSINASTNIYAMLEYVEEIVTDGKGNYSINNNV